MSFFKSVMNLHAVQLVSSSSMAHNIRGPEHGSTGRENRCWTERVVSKPGIVTIGFSVSRSGASGLELHPWFQTDVITSTARSMMTTVVKVKDEVEADVWLRGF